MHKCEKVCFLINRDPCIACVLHTILIKIKIFKNGNRNSYNHFACVGVTLLHLFKDYPMFSRLQLDSSVIQSG